MQEQTWKFKAFTAAEMPNDFYHDKEQWTADYVSGSSLGKIFSSSFASWKFERDRPKKALIFGTQSHTNFESSELFHKTHRRAPDVADYKDAITSQAALATKLKGFGLTGTSGKQYPELIEKMVNCGEDLNVMWLIDMIAQCQAWADGVELVDAKDYDACVNMRKVLELIPEHNACMNSLTAHREYSLFGIINGVKVKVRLDHVDTCTDPDYIRACGYDPEIHPEIIVITDYKTTQSANPKEFPRLVFNLGYYLKMALQRDLFVKCFNETRPVVVRLLAQEKTEPYLPLAFRMTQVQLGIGRDQYMSVINDFAICKESDVWPSYSNGCPEVELETPAWVLSQYQHIVNPEQ